VVYLEKYIGGIMAAPKALVGAKAAVKINGIKVAFAAGVDITHTPILERLNVLDELPSKEISYVGFECSASVTAFKVDDNAALALELDPTNLDDLLTAGDISFEVYNRVSDKLEYVMNGVKFAGGTGRVDARGIWSGTWNFEGRIGRGII
jgi:hypothetical protein